MRHRVAGKHLNRTSAHRKALRRNLAASLFEHGTISTTREKARFVQSFAEKLITLAKDGSLHARRRAISLLQDRDICKVEDGEPVKETTVIQKLFSEIGPRFQNRNGGYTRIINLPLRRIGDNGRLVLLQLVEAEVKAARKVTDAPPTEAVRIATPAESPEGTAVEESPLPQTDESEPQDGTKAPTDTDVDLEKPDDADDEQEKAEDDESDTQKLDEKS